MPIFDFEAKPISALVFDIQLNMVVFPVLERPMIPQLSAIMLLFCDHGAKIQKLSSKIHEIGIINTKVEATACHVNARAEVGEGTELERA